MWLGPRKAQRDDAKVGIPRDRSEMNATPTQSFGDGTTKRVPGIDTASGYGFAGIVVQVLMMYIISRDLLMSSSFLNHYIPVAGTLQARGAIALLIGWVAWSRGFGPGFGAFRQWGWIVLGSFALMFLVEGMLTITAGTNSRRIIVVAVNSGIFMFSVSSAYLFAVHGRTTAEALKFLIQPYVYLSLILAVLGLTAWLLVQTGLVDPTDWFVPDQFASGRLASDESTSYYSAPFYLSGILNESSGRFLGLSFHRASGMFEEPALAAFFVTPAIFLMPLVFRHRSGRWKKLGLGILTILAFLIVVNSTTNMFIMLVLGLLILSKVMLTHPQAGARTLAALGLLMLSALTWVTFARLGGIGSEFRSVTSSQVEYLQQSLDYGDLLGPGILEPVPPGDPRGVVQRGILSWLAVLFHVGVLGVLGIRWLLSRSSWWYLGGAMLYLAGHSMKSFGHTATTGYYLYMLVVLALTLACYWQTSRSKGAAASQRGGRQQPVYPRTDPGTVLPR